VDYRRHFLAAIRQEQEAMAADKPPAYLFGCASIQLRGNHQGAVAGAQHREAQHQS